MMSLDGPRPAVRPRLFTVILNWNGKRDLLECIRSVQAASYPCEVIVVDNASSDDSVESLRIEFPTVLVIQNETNLGFAGNNVGMEEALLRGADYVLLLNNDTWVDPGCFEKLIEVAEEKPEAGILSPRICYYSNPKLIWYDGGKLEKINGLWSSGHFHADSLEDSVVDRVGAVDYICGCAMLIRRSVIQKIGGLDPKFFMYWEDVDYSLRAQQAGFQLVHVPSARVLHKVSHSFGGTDSPEAYYYVKRNVYLLSKKHTNVCARMVLLWKHLRHCFWEYCDLMHEKSGVQAVAIAEAGWHSFIGRWGRRRGSLPPLVLKRLERRRQRSHK